MAHLDQNESQESLRKSVNDTSRRLESLFGDACEFSFAVEHGEFFLTEVNPGKRGLGVANVRMALDFFAKGYIPLTRACNGLGLMEGGSVTEVGLSLLGSYRWKSC